MANKPQKTIKEHLAAILPAIERCGWYEDEYEDPDCPKERAALNAIATIEAALDRPIKSAEEWYLTAFPTYQPPEHQKGWCDFIRAIQQDAIASKKKEVEE